MKQPYTSLTIDCEACGEIVTFRHTPKLYQLKNCAECDAIFKVTGLDPLVIELIEDLPDPNPTRNESHPDDSHLRHVTEDDMPRVHIIRSIAPSIRKVDRSSMTDDE